MATVSIDSRKCPGMRDMCKPIQSCPTGAIRYVEDETNPLGGVMQIDSDSCTACGVCIGLCCGSAIQMM